MEDPNVSDIFYMFDVFFTLLENPNIANQNNLQNIRKAFKCGWFIELAVNKAFKEKAENVLDRYLCNYWLQSKRIVVHKCSDLENACDKLLEVYMKSAAVSNETINELVTLYVQHCGNERLNNFLTRMLLNSVSTNVILDSLNSIGIGLSETEDEAILMSWEVEARNGNEEKVSACIHKMFDDGHLPTLIKFVTSSKQNDITRKLIMEILLLKVNNNDAEFCIALFNINKQSLFTLLESDEQFYINVLDTLFYFGRNMTKQGSIWVSDYEFSYHNLVKVIDVLLDGPKTIRRIMNSRLELVKTLPNNKIWNDISNEY